MLGEVVASNASSEWLEVGGSKETLESNGGESEREDPVEVVDGISTFCFKCIMRLIDGEIVLNVMAFELWRNLGL
jgi:hypothetical protein